jgi:hypothetical protein
VVGATIFFAETLLIGTPPGLPSANLSPTADHRRLSFGLSRQALSYPVGTPVRDPQNFAELLLIAAPPGPPSASVEWLLLLISLACL